MEKDFLFIHHYSIVTATKYKKVTRAMFKEAFIKEFKPKAKENEQNNKNIRREQAWRKVPC